MAESKRGFAKKNSVSSSKSSLCSPHQSSGIRKIQQMRKKPSILYDLPERIQHTNHSDDSSNGTAEQMILPNRTYKFICGGYNNKNDCSFKGQNIEWTASFPHPIEELTYPSLQRFEFESSSSTVRILRS